MSMRILNYLNGICMVLPTFSFEATDDLDTGVLLCVGILTLDHC